MNKRNYLPAFSVLETAVSMVISAIVIGLIFVVFTIMSERMNDFKNQNQYVADLNRMTYSFNKDIFESETMLISENQISFYSYSGNLIKYSIYPDHFLRTKEVFVDTFLIPIREFRVDTIQNKTKQIVFQKLSLKIDVNTEPMQLKFFKKIYSNQLLIKDLKK